MLGPKDHKEGKAPRMEGAKDPDTPRKEQVASTIASSEAYASLVDEEDIFLIWLACYVLDKFELDMLGLIVRGNDPPPSHLAMYEETFEVGLGSLFLVCSWSPSFS